MCRGNNLESVTKTAPGEDKTAPGEGTQRRGGPKPAVPGGKWLEELAGRARRPARGGQEPTEVKSKSGI